MKYPIEEIVGKIAADQLSETERKEILVWLTENENHKVKLSELLKIYYEEKSADSKKAFEQFSKNNFIKTIKINKSKKPVYLKMTIAASVALFLCLGYFLKSFEVENSDIINGLTLVTADGKHINLDKESESQFSLENTLFSKTKNLLTYKSDLTNNEEPSYNTLYIPYGRTFKLQLSDSTLVCLNSGSKLTYPVKFIKGKERLVSLEGEAYFEVTSNKKMPFIVSTDQMKTKVFGTHFNVNAYKNNESEKVSLLEGSVGVSNNQDKKIKMIQPDQQFTWDKSIDNYTIATIDATTTINWISGKLKFTQEPLEAIAKRLERKYNIQINFENKNLKQKKFTGLFKDESIKQILEILKAANSFEYEFLEEKNQLTIK